MCAHAPVRLPEATLNWKWSAHQHHFLAGSEGRFWIPTYLRIDTDLGCRAHSHTGVRARTCVRTQMHVGAHSTARVHLFLINAHGPRTGTFRRVHRLCMLLLRVRPDQPTIRRVLLMGAPTQTRSFCHGMLYYFLIFHMAVTQVSHHSLVFLVVANYLWRWLHEAPRTAKGTIPTRRTTNMKAITRLAI